jgi:ankyrin repeat protein
MKTALLAICISCLISRLEAEDQLNSSLLRAAFSGNLRSVTQLLSDGANPNCSLGAYEKSAFARDGGLSPIGSEAWTPIMAVAGSKTIPDVQIAISRALLKAGAKLESVDSRGASALFIAIDNSNVELAVFLLSQGASPFLKVGVYIDNVADETPLHRAVGHPLIVTELLKAGADPTAKSAAGLTPLQLAKDLGFTESEAILRKIETRPRP